MAAPPASAPASSWRLSASCAPLRAEPFGVERLEQHARELATLLVAAKVGGGEDPAFFTRFRANAQALREANAIVSSAARVGETLASDAEWLTDNFYIVEEQLREIRDDLPRPFYRELPKNVDGEARVHVLAVELISHTDSVLDEETIVRFVREFQTVTPLTMGELWALPIMLRLVLVENLRRIAAHMLASRACKEEARRLAELWDKQGTVSLDFSDASECGGLIVCLIEQFQGSRPELAGRLRELEHQLAARQIASHQVIHVEHQRQAANQVTIGNVITSMRLISALDWAEFFERTSLAEAVLRTDPAEVYPRMDYDTRDRYRHVVERIAKGSRVAETEVAATAVKLASREIKESVAHHVGYWLVAAGLQHLEAQFQFRPKLHYRLIRALRRHANAVYLGGTVLLTGLLVAAVALFASTHGLTLILVVLFSALMLIPASDLAVNLMNVLITSRVSPWLLPKLDFQTGIPAGNRTILVVPSMLSNAGEVAALLERLEMHYLSNPDPTLSFALLTDFADALHEQMPDDDALVEQARQGIRELNQRHGRGHAAPFYLFHRRRHWNERERKWMGWERKRGKLLEFHRLLRKQTTSYSVVEGTTDRLVGPHAEPVRHILTLDSDTQLPHGAAQKLIGTLAHPLNRPRFDDSGRLTSGYVLLQPRVSVQLSSANRSRFARLFANNPGIDPYSTSASDVYQDLYGEGSFTGKGIYELEAFEKLLADAFPENQILSHDLIEGCHTRVALVSDIEVYDNYPPRYEAEARRQHRWARGDWQILPWLFSRVPTAGERRRNPLSVLSRWKIFDNLRRSLVAPALLAFLLVGWLAAPSLAVFTSLAGLLVVGFPLLAQLALGLHGWPRDVSFASHVRVLLTDLRKSLLQSVFLLAVLPHRAWLMVDAVARTLYRLMLSRRNLLEWETASEVERQMSASRWSALLHLWFVPVLAVVVGLLLPPVALLSAAPILLAWLVSPLLSHWLAQPPAARSTGVLTAEQRQQLRLQARRIWSFFEAYVGPDGNWLPPDNMQEYPAEKIAYRISPTNEGLFLVSGLVARDLGYVTLHNLVDVWEKNLSSWQRFDQLHGHFYNWYDTSNLQPLFPRYVSTVDSGNLAACLLTMQHGIRDLCQQPINGEAIQHGLRDTLDMILSDGDRFGVTADRQAGPLWQPLHQELTALRESAPSDSERMQVAADRIADLVAAFSASADSFHGQLLKKLNMLVGHLRSLRTEWDLLLPWRSLLTAIPHQDGAWRAVRATFETAHSLDDLCKLQENLAPALADVLSSVERQPDDASAERAWLAKLQDAVHSSTRAASDLHGRLMRLATRTEQMALAMDFRFLFDPQRRLFAIGFNLEDGKLDRSRYDMLCSEARLASYLAIAKGDVEARHWFRLGRQITETAGQLALLSWGGTMFEYLMPPLFLHAYESSLLSQSGRAAVARQQEFGRQVGIPWGVSECAFGALAINSDYHYRSFGVPGLGLKRGLAKDMVVSPYSTFLAVEVDPVGSLLNLQRLERAGGLGHWGFYEALDYTPERVPPGRRLIVVRCHMAHHQGMSLIALGNLLGGGSVRRRFHEHALVRATELLLQERVPVAAPKYQPHAEEDMVRAESPLEQELVSRKIVGIALGPPRTHLLSNGEYSVMLTSAGSGYSQCDGIALSRWRPDTTRDHWGQFLYLRDVETGDVWSPTFQPTCIAPDRYEVVYSIDKADFHRRDGELESHLEVVVSPDNNAEVRQLRITNHGAETREIEITSYVEIALTTQQADVSHPAFHKLFVETEYIAEEASLLARRRPRDANQPPIWAVHTLCPFGDWHHVEYETSRQAFLGRNRSVQSPHALTTREPLGGTTGAVLDPIFALRCKLRIPAYESASIGLTTALAKSREEALALADQYHDPRGVQRAFELAWAYSQVELRHLHVSPAMAHLYQRLGSSLLYPNAAVRAPAETILKNRQGQRGLWPYGISGDLPIMLVHVTEPDHTELVRELLTAQAYLLGKGLKADLVIVNDYPGSYFDALQDQLVTIINEQQVISAEKRLGVYLLRGAQMPAEDKTLLDATAAVVLHGDRGSINIQLEAIAAQTPEASMTLPVAPAMPAERSSPLGPGDAPFTSAQYVRVEDLEFWNGYGGFAHDGREYHIRLTDVIATPMPWSNVIANEQFGCLLTESGGGYTWFGNSRENKLTSWANDPTTDTPGEAIYLRDQETGEIFSPLAGIRRGGEEYWVQHGQGYSRYLHAAAGIEQELTVSIAAEDAVKFIVLKLTNRQSMARRLSVAYVAEWVLGVGREQTQMHLATSMDRTTGALLARNAFHPELPNQVAFLHVLGTNRQVSGDRAEILGYFGSFQNPAGMQKTAFSGRTGACLDPAGAVQTSIVLPPHQSTTVIFLLGAGEDQTAAERLLKKYSSPESVEDAISQQVRQWDETLTTIQVHTPNRALDLLVNRWLVYQTLSCRVWGRSAYYQSSGAFGFRDQLQDSMALVYSHPEVARRHLLRAAARQYSEGDVQHWWHPPHGRGTRTRFSDDLLWLPFVVLHYVAITGDEAVLDEEAGFLKSPQLDAHEQERYELPDVAAEQASLYEHCLRAIGRGFRLGPHGLPLMGCGDWNDGMNKVGEGGRGESVWVGWFLLVLLERFLPVMHNRGDLDQADDLQARADALREALEREAWDDQWYRRAYFDDGQPLGSAQNEECQIDSIVQTWSVMARAQPERARSAMEAVWDRLVLQDAGLVLLFAPPFDKSELDPGYIKGYLPGIRENGGQYTHPALWLIEALTLLGDGQRAMQVFDLVNPIHHAQSAADVLRYQVEPYVVAADVYGVAPHVGRGGWTWYTGSAAWTYRAALEFILGFRLRVGEVTFEPQVPPDWDEFEVTYRHQGKSTRYRLQRGSDGKFHQRSPAQRLLPAEHSAS